MSVSERALTRPSTARPSHKPESPTPSSTPGLTFARATATFGPPARRYRYQQYTAQADRTTRHTVTATVEFASFP